MKPLAYTLFTLLFLTFSNLSLGQDEDGMHYGALETFRYWADEDPWEGITVFHGQYWASSHFSKEYILYMELKVPTETAQNFILDNGLEPANDKEKYPSDAPKWFNPSANLKEYAGAQGSKYFIDVHTGHMFMYEVQL